jgi:pimeloyl-ACP methyl ester carboxylesterase
LRVRQWPTGGHMPQTAGIYFCMSQSGQTDHRPPLLLIHGAGSSHLCWPAELRRLTGHTVYAIDLPGHGKSAGIGKHTIAAYTAEVIRFLTAMGIYQATLIGHSMGGAIALQAAYEYPNQVAALGLVASGATINVPPDLIENLSNATMIPVAFEWFQKHLFSVNSSEEMMIKAMRILEQARPGVLYGDWQACAQFDLRSKIHQIAAPVWLATGIEDRITPVSGANFIASQLTSARMQIVPRSGHMLMLEKPQYIGASLRGFLAELEHHP